MKNENTAIGKENSTHNVLEAAFRALKERQKKTRLILTMYPAKGAFKILNEEDARIDEVEAYIMELHEKQLKNKKPAVLVKYDYDSFPVEWKKENPNPHEGKVFVDLGELKQMPGHSFLLNYEGGGTIILHTENLIEVPADEI